MTIHIPEVLSSGTAERFTQALSNADWISGHATAGEMSRLVKRNRQLPETHPLAVQLGNAILDVLEVHPLFTSYALPAQIVPPLFNAHRDEEHYGRHIDGALRPIAGHSLRVRTDISCTLFLSEPDAYDGGELVIQHANGETRAHKLAAGSLLLYPSISVHHITPVTRGERLVAFFWVQSLVRSNEKRDLLFHLDRTIQRLRTITQDESSLVDLIGHYHNLLRLWADP